MVYCAKIVRIWSYPGPHFSRIRTEHEEIRSISPYSVQMRENAEKMRTRITPNTDSFYACRNLKVFSKLEYKVDTSYNWHDNTSKLWCQHNICVKQIRKDTQHTSLGNTAQKMNFSFKVFFSGEIFNGKMIVWRIR